MPMHPFFGRLQPGIAMQYGIALLLLAAASLAPAGITDNFLDEEREADFRTNLIFEWARTGVPISDDMIGGAFQFGKDLATSTVTISNHGQNDQNETAYSVPLAGDKLDLYRKLDFPGCPQTVNCRFYFIQKTGEEPREAFRKGDTFLIDKVEVMTKDSGEFLHRFTLSEAERTTDGPKPMPGRKGKAFATCLSNIRLRKWALYVGFNNYIYPFVSRQDKETIARAPLPEVPRADSSGVKKAEAKPAGKGGASSKKW